MKEIKAIRYDEIFKSLISDYFSDFAKVITDYEIINLPKSVDILIIEVTKPIKNYVKIFTYFKKFNIIEFKSISDPFKISRDLYKLGIYYNGVLLKEDRANTINTTFTLVSSKRPRKLLNIYKSNLIEYGNGIYEIRDIAIIPIHIIVVEELEVGIEKELKVLKEFTTKKVADEFIEKVVHQYKIGDKDMEKYINILFSFFPLQIDKIMKKEKIEMTKLEKNFDYVATRYGLKQKYLEEGREEGREEGTKEIIRKLHKKGFSEKEISEFLSINIGSVNHILKS